MKTGKIQEVIPSKRGGKDWAGRKLRRNPTIKAGQKATEEPDDKGWAETTGDPSDKGRAREGFDGRFGVGSERLFTSPNGIIGKNEDCMLEGGKSSG